MIHGKVPTWVKLDQLQKGEGLLFCEACKWQDYEPAARNPECPTCGEKLYVVSKTEVLEDE